MGQGAARTAAELIVCVARTDTFRRNARRLLALMSAHAAPSRSTLQYYEKLVPILYTTGPFSVLAPIKWLLLNAVGLFRPIVRGPVGQGGRLVWAIKSASLACENLMLALRATGYDSCPMEGFDERRVKRLLRLGRGAHVVMVIGAGRRAKGGVYGPQFRLPLEEFVFEH